MGSDNINSPKITAYGEKRIFKKPRGAFLDKRAYPINPTTTVGKAIAVLSSIIIKDLPLNCFIPIRKPAGTPIETEISVAAPENLKEANTTS